MQVDVKRILIVEDHPIVSDSLSRLVIALFPGAACVQAPTGSKGLAYLNGSTFDIILLDINLPDMSGIDFCAEAIARIPSLKILAVTSLAQRHVIEKSVAAGMKGFVLKTSDIHDISDGIRHVLAGETYFGRGVKEIMTGHAADGAPVPLVTRREGEILKLIAEGNTNQEIAAKLFISASTVDSHRKNLLVKFNARNTAALVREAISRGLI